MQWGIYTGAYDGIYSAYRAAQGDTKRLLAKIALRSTAHWFGAWIRDTDAEASARRYIQSVTGGDSNLLAQIAVFRLDPWEQVACSTVPGAARQGSFRSWINGFARGIGDARAVLILQPDVPFALCSPGQRRWLDMLAYASGRFTALPHTTVYIDAGAAQWASVGQAASLLERAGVRHARGFALNTTEYDSTARELSFGAQILRRLGAAGIRGKHFVINTAENGAPFLNGQYPGDPSNPRVCASRHDRICATLGIPPTTRVADPRWGLSPQARSLAARYADAYLWIGRPWLASGAGAFDLHRALGLIKSSPF
jgi:endoglucanase